MTADHTPERLSELPPMPFVMARLLADPEVAQWFAAVKSILADVEARLAAVEALADEWLGWADGRSTPRIDAFRDAAEALKLALHPHPVRAARAGRRRHVTRWLCVATRRESRRVRHRRRSHGTRRRVRAVWGHGGRVGRGKRGVVSTWLSHTGAHIRGRVFRERRDPGERPRWAMEVINTATGQVLAVDHCTVFGKVPPEAHVAVGAARAAWFYGYTRKGVHE